MLAIETAGPFCSVAVYTSAHILATAKSDVPNSHAANLHRLIAACMQHAGIGFSDIQAVAVSSGPGSYTGLRIGMAAAKAICYLQSIPLITVSSLAALNDVLQRESDSCDAYAAVMDSKRDEVFIRITDAQGAELLKAYPCKANEERIKIFEGKKVAVAGNAVQKIQSAIPSVFWQVCDKHFAAENMQSIATGKMNMQQFADTAYVEPEYNGSYAKTAF